jgi:hypothetical protein
MLADGFGGGSKAGIKRYKGRDAEKHPAFGKA